MIKDGVLVEYPETRSNSSSIRSLRDSMSNDERTEVDNRLFVGKLLEETYDEYHTEIEMLILSISNYTHREISEVLNISRIGVTRRIVKAREVLREKAEDMVGE